MYQVLYRKWRPKTFADVVGQPHVTETLKNELRSDRIAHAYLFTGSRGTGKTTCAKIFAKAVNCLHPVDGNPTGVMEEAAFESAGLNWRYITVRVLPTHDKWFGVTYKEDKPVVVESIRQLIADGVYPEKLYG